MAAVKRHDRKGRKNSTRKSIFQFFGGCFGISIKGKTVPVNDQPIPMSTEIISSSREIHVVEAEEGSTQLPAAPLHEVIDYEKSKKWDDSSGVKPEYSMGREIRTKPAKLSHSVSLPLLTQKNDDNQIAKKGKKGKREKELSVAGDYDSLFGAIVIMVTLIVMLIWGRACAILCTAAWFYFIPLLRANVDQDYSLKHTNGKNLVDLDSKEYKKKVVLQGLLHRNQVGFETRSLI